MRTSSLRAVLAVACVSLTLFCDKQNPAKPGVSDLPGTWRAVISAMPPVLPQAIKVSLTLRQADNGYDLRIEKDSSNVPLLTHSGSWSTTGTPGSDTLVLTGTQCFIIDTTAAPDTLKPLDNETCGLPIRLPVTGKLTSATTWTVKLSDLGPIVEAFPIPESFKPELPKMSLELQKQ